MEIMKAPESCANEEWQIMQAVSVAQNLVTSKSENVNEDCYNYYSQKQREHT